MATFIFQRAGWSLQISKSSRTFAVSFSTNLPRRQKHRTIASEASDALRSSRLETSRRSARSSDLHQNFPSTRVSQAQQARRATTAASPSLQASNHEPPPTSKRQQEAAARSIDPGELANGLSDKPFVLEDDSRHVDWARSFHGLSKEAFTKEAAEILLAPINPDDIEVKPDGIVYLPEIKYRRILNRAFGPGGWGLAPRGESIVTTKAVTREYALVALGR